MRSLLESIRDRKTTNELFFLTQLTGKPDKMDQNKIYAAIHKILHHDGATLEADPNSPHGYKKVYKNPTPLIKKLGNWCAPRETNVYTGLAATRYFGLDSKYDINYVLIEYLFQGDEHEWDWEGYDYYKLASAISECIKNVPGYKTTPILILPYIRDGVVLGNHIYVVNPLRPDKPIDLNKIVGDVMVYELLK